MVNHVRLELLQLQDVFVHLVNKYTDKARANCHSPHAASAFCHAFYHEVFEPEMLERSQEIHNRIKEGEEIIGAEVTSDGTSVAPLHIEELIRQAFEVILMVGVEFTNSGHTFSECTCINDLGNLVEDMMRKGTWGHP